MNESIVDINSNFKRVLEAINAKPSGCAFIIKENKLVGVFTDGDMRRALLKGYGLEQPFDEKLLRNDFVKAKQGDDVDSLLKKTNRFVRLVPIVDENDYPVDYFQYDKRAHFTPVAEPSLGSKELDYLTDAFISTWISSRGEYIDRFENNFSDFIGTQHAVAVSNGTTALHLALVVLGIGPGDEVIVPNLTFAASVNTVLHAGATPVLVDIDKEFWTIDPKEIEKAITPKTKAIMPVHIYGIPCDMDAIMEIAKKHNLYVVEDCAEAHGAEFNGKKVGSIGDIGCFSFFANKIITTGEGGMCTTNNEKLKEKLHLYRDHGMSRTKKYHHEVVGFNYRMTNLQAAIGCAQLERIEEILKGRMDLEQKYKKHFEGKEIVWPSDSDERRKRVVWLVSCLMQDRDNYIREMQKMKIDIRPFFTPMGEMDIYKEFNFSKENSLLISKIGINLPTSHKVTDEVVESVNELFT